VSNSYGGQTALFHYYGTKWAQYDRKSAFLKNWRPCDSYLGSDIKCLCRSRQCVLICFIRQERMVTRKLQTSS
jgi:hypothetical protein